MKTSIAFAIENFHPHGGGAEAYLVDLAHSFARHGWKVHVYAETWDHTIPWATFHAIPLPRRAPGWLRILLFALRHQRLARRAGHDLVYGVGNTLIMDVYQSHGGVHWCTAMRKIAAAPAPLLRFGKRLLTFLSLKHHLRHWIESAAFRQRHPVTYIAISELVRQDICRWHRIRPEDVHLVHNGIDPQRFAPATLASRREAARRTFGLADGITCLAFVSYELEKKGIRPLLQACAMLKKKDIPFQLLVAGRRPTASLRALLRRLDLEDLVVWPGPVRDVVSVYAAADAFVLPTYYDACSLATLEAMCCGLPVLTTESNGAAGIIEHGTSGLVASHPPRAVELAALLERLCLPEERRRLGEAARQRVAPYTKAANHRAIIELCEKAVAGKRQSSSTPTTPPATCFQERPPSPSPSA